MKEFLSRLKPYLKLIFGVGTILFLGRTLSNNWREVASIRIDGEGVIFLGLGLISTLIGYGVGGLMWSWILRECSQSLPVFWLIRVYLRTGLAKYIPGNVWHYYGRITALKTVDVSTGTATFSVFIEPLLFSASALLVVLLSSQMSRNLSQSSWFSWQTVGLIGLLASLHPLFLNSVLTLLGKLKMKVTKSSAEVKVRVLEFKRYPLLPLLGGLLYTAFRGLGFLCVFLAFSPVSWEQFLLVLNAFSLAWISSVLIPVVPGGVGVFEASAIAILGQSFSTGLVFSAIAIYRLVNTLAEITGAALASIPTVRKS